MVDLATWPTDTTPATETKWSQMGRRLLLDGVIGDTTETGEFQPFADSTGMQVKLHSGEVIIRGFFALTSADTTLAIATANSTNPRIDRVVARLDQSGASAVIKLLVVTGSAAATPAAPALSNTATLKDVPIGQIRVEAGASTITAAKVTDERLYAVTNAFPYVKTPRWTGTLDGTGGDAFAHGLGSSFPQQVTTLQAFYKGNSGEAKPLSINFVDATNIGVVGGTAGRAYYVIGCYTQTVPTPW